MGGHERPADRLPPNLRSADRPLLGGRAMLHLVNERIVVADAGEIAGRKSLRCGSNARLRHLGGTVEEHSAGHSLRHRFFDRHPLCYPAFRRERVISARLSWLPMRSDCAFDRVGRSVSSRYTVPVKGLARRYLSKAVYHSIERRASGPPKRGGTIMAKDDYFVLAYRILAYLYACLKAGEQVLLNAIGPEALGINNGYWISTLRMLSEEGYIAGITFPAPVGTIQLAQFRNLQITPKGIEYLWEDRQMEKASDFLRAGKHTVVGI